MVNLCFPVCRTFIDTSVLVSECGGQWGQKENETGFGKKKDKRIERMQQVRK